MTLEQAKQHLLAYRPGTRDESDADVKVALEMARANPELGRWLESQLRMAEEIRGELRSVAVPAALKERILESRKIVQVPFWNQSRLATVLGLAAAITIVASLLFFWMGRGSEDRSFTGFQARMVGEVLRVYSMDIRTNSAAAVRNYLATSGAPASFALPARLQSTPVLGGAKLSWQAKPVSMVCFEGPKKETLFLFVISKSDIEAGRIPENLQEREVKGLPSISWSTGENVFLLSGKVAPEELKALVNSGNAKLILPGADVAAG